jgi:hypothetical protein
MEATDFRSITYSGVEDLTQWLQRISTVDPVIYPCWPADRQQLLVALRWPDGEPYELSIALNREAAVANRIPGRLWFCVPKKELRSHTDVDPSLCK